MLNTSKTINLDIAQLGITLEKRGETWESILQKMRGLMGNRKVGSLVELKTLLEKLTEKDQMSPEVLKEKSEIWRIARDQVDKALALLMNAYKRIEPELNLFYFTADAPCECGKMNTLGAIDIIQGLSDIQKFVEKEFSDAKTAAAIQTGKRGNPRKPMKEVKTSIKYHDVGGMKVPHYIITETEIEKQQLSLPIINRPSPPPALPPAREELPQIIRPRKETISESI